MAKRRPTTAKIQNRRARFDYQLGDSFSVGVVLNGRETKALRTGRGQLRGAYVSLIGGELWLVGAQISGTSAGPIAESEQTRNRKLLAKRREIEAMTAFKQQGLSLVPLEFLTGGRFIKLKLAVGRGRKRYDKRQAIRRREAERTVRRAF